VLVYTHDSIGVGEDGPTHQPVEHVASLRLIPNLSLWRPCDAVETAVAWAAAIERADGPTALVLTRQGVPHQPRSEDQIADIARGGYVLRDCDGPPAAILIATGSEVGLASAAAETLTGEGIAVRVVSLPCVDVFEAQSQAWREAVLPPAVSCRVVIEAGVTRGWEAYAGPGGRVLGLDRYGESAPASAVFEHLGLTVSAVVEQVRALVAGAQDG
jgi:transketolase